MVTTTNFDTAKPKTARCAIGWTRVAVQRSCKREPSELFFRFAPVATIYGINTGSQHALDEEIGRVLPVVLAGGLGLVVGGFAAVGHQLRPGLLAHLDSQRHDAVPAHTMPLSRERALRDMYLALRTEKPNPKVRNSSINHQCLTSAAASGVRMRGGLRSVSL